MNASVLEAKVRAKDSRAALINLLHDCGVGEEVFKLLAQVWVDVRVEGYISGLHDVTEAVETQAYERGYRSGRAETT